MGVFVLYNDAACTEQFAVGSTIPITYDSIDAPPSSIVVDGKTYLYFTGYGQRIRLPSSLTGTAPILQSSKNRAPTTTRKYFKNGVSADIMETNNYSGENRIEFRPLYLNGQQIADGEAYTSIEPSSVYCIEFVYGGKTFIGFSNPVSSPDVVTIIPIFCAELAFWETALRPPYDYGEKPDENGGQGTGKITDTGVHRSATPSAGIPLGGRGLHAYVATPAGYRSLQEYLWGEGNTLAKSLWQKFLNKTHNPSSCVVACFRLPTIFMPTSGTASGVQIAGINLPTTGTMAVDLGYKSATVSLGTLEPPFGSWLDYCGVTCKIYIPFCGEIAVDAAQIFNREIKIEYRCDTFNGNLGATVFAGNHQIADLTANVAYPIPVSGGDTGTLDRIGALATGALAIAAAESGGAAMAAIAGAAGGFAGSQYKTYLNNSNTSGSVNSCINGVAYVEYIAPTTAYPYQDSAAYLNAYGLPAPAFSGQLSAFAGGYGEFDVQKNAGDTISILGASDEEKAEIIRLLGEGVVV